MTKNFLVFIILFCVQCGFSQENGNAQAFEIIDHNGDVMPETKNDPITDETIFNQADVDKKADFPGGIMAFYKFVASTFITPDEPGLNGKIVISFIIEKDGSLTDLKILRNIGYGTGTEALRTVSESPKWAPATYQGRSVRSNFVLPISIASSN